MLPDLVLCHFEVRGGVPWLAILRTARNKEVDLIVMGSYSVRRLSTRADFGKPHLGENAQQVSLRARCPVHIVTSLM